MCNKKYLFSTFGFYQDLDGKFSFNIRRRMQNRKNYLHYSTNNASSFLYDATSAQNSQIGNSFYDLTSAKSANALNSELIFAALISTSSGNTWIMERNSINGSIPLSKFRFEYIILYGSNLVKAK